jgi:cytochrome b6-f complex iron-sulfur subunit
VYLKGEGLDKPILILRTSDDKYLACADTCTHAGRKLDPVPGNPVLRCCSVGHSTFDYDGNVIKGPANQPLTRYETELSGDDLLVHIK